MQRIRELDALRGLAAIAVVLYHIGMLHLSFRVYCGWSAVDLFFVLSGYLITTILISHPPTLDFAAAFYGRRALRIWPIYYLSLFALLFADRWFASPEPWDSLPHYLTYTLNLQMYWKEQPLPAHRALDHTWTLSVEEQFYLLWPALVLLAGRRRVIPLASAIGLASVAARLAGFQPFILLARADGLALGAILAALLVDREWRTRHRGALTFAFASIGMASLAGVAAYGIVRRLGVGTTLDTETCLIPVFSIGYFGLIGLVVLWEGHASLALLRARPLVYLGKISYGIYLYHAIILILAHDFADRAGLGYPPWLQAAAFVGSLAAADLSWRLIERPLLSLKAWLPYEATPSPSPLPHPEAATTG
jgi:peptidoglycan/LPS O-acetylase OafA/YrhL